MLASILNTATEDITLLEILLCSGVSLALGTVIALVYMYKNVYSKNFVVTLVLLPAMIQAVIMLVNGNLGTGVAVMGAFSLVRFRSVPGSAREIAAVFFAMAVGLATGMGYLLYAALFTAILSAAMLLFSAVPFGECGDVRSLRVMIPEDLDYCSAFDDLFARYTKECTLEKVRTTNLGSLFELSYRVTLRDKAKEKELLDKIRQRNGNLNITFGKVSAARDEL